MEKNSFVIYGAWATMAVALPDEQAGKLYKAMCAKKLGMPVEIQDDTLKAIYEMISKQLDIDDAKYAETCKQKSEAGKKGNEKRWGNGKCDNSNRKTSQSIADHRKCDNSNRKTSLYDSEYEYESEYDSENEYDSVSENEQPTVAKKSKTHARHKHGEYKHVLLSDEELQKLEVEHGKPETAAAIKKVDEYCEETGKSYKNYYLVIKRWGYTAPTPRNGTTEKPFLDRVKEISQWTIYGGDDDEDVIPFEQSGF